MTRDYIEFQDRSVPKAYFLSFRGYGTWLHGDERLSMDRKEFNKFGQGKIPPNVKLKQTEISELKNNPFTFTARMRDVIRTSIEEVCAFRKYHLIAVNVRSNHVHCVAAGAARPELIMNSFKSYATRHLKERSLISEGIKVWSRHGSTKYLWTEEQIANAIFYVLNGQGDELPDF